MICAAQCGSCARLDNDVIDQIITPIVYRVIFLPWTLTDDTAKSLVRRLFKA